MLTMEMFFFSYLLSGGDWEICLIINKAKYFGLIASHLQSLPGEEEQVSLPCSHSSSQLSQYGLCERYGAP